MSTYAHLDRLHEDDEDAFVVEEVSLYASSRNGDAHVPGVPGLFSVRTETARNALRVRIQRHLDSLSHSEAAELLEAHTQLAEGQKHAFDQVIVVKIPRAIVVAVRERRAGVVGEAGAAADA